ncbi:MAG: hypothetical protein Q9208_003541 [Pyrenodesmia sp. 3 TL-2023]
MDFDGVYIDLRTILAALTISANFLEHEATRSAAGAARESSSASAAAAASHIRSILGPAAAGLSTAAPDTASKQPPGAQQHASVAGISEEDVTGLLNAAAGPTSVGQAAVASSGPEVPSRYKGSVPQP